MKNGGTDFWREISENFISFVKTPFKNLKEYWSQIPVILIPTSLSMFSDFNKWVIARWWVWLPTLLFIIFCIIHIFSKNESRNKLKLEVDKLKENENVLVSTLESIPDRIITSTFNFLNFGYSERITLYRYENSQFVTVSRYAKNPNYKKGGRKSYTYSEGFISNSWNSGEFIIDNLPDPKRKSREYISTVRKHCNISEQTIKEIRMKSRCYYCRNLDSPNGDPIAVIVFESTEPQFPVSTHEIDKLLTSSIGNLISSIVSINAVGKGGGS